MEKKEHLEQVRHSLAHLLAAAVMELWPSVMRAIGPAIDNGFYYDFEFKKPISENDFPRIEEKMREIYPTWSTFNKIKLSKKDALLEYKDNPYKKELIEEFSKEDVPLSFYQSGDYKDLCKGGHVKNMQSVDMNAFRLNRMAGAYWRGDEKNTMLTRIYGLAFHTKEELDSYIVQLEEAKKRDHRKLGKELDLFIFSELIGSGLPLFTPKGTVLREEINTFSQELRIKRGFLRVWTPHITKNDLYKVSGHWDKFGDELFLVTSQETKDQLVIKPMNCPHHQQIYASRPRSYRDLPIRYLETTTIYRDEKAGELLGLSRVRSITQDDSHIFCTPQQLEKEYEQVIEVVKEFYEKLDMPLRIRLSFCDPKTPEKYLGGQSLWESSQAILTNVVKKNNMDFFIAEGEAVFYGPKIDFMATDVLGREWQLATGQLDFVQPDRFNLTYTDLDGKDKTPIMIHFAVAGSLERFLSVYIEHTGGAFPLWLSPVQVKILPISEKHRKYAQEILGKLSDAQIRVELDGSDETLGKKIRLAKLEKVPYFLVLGDKEIKEKTVTLENRYGKPSESFSVEELLTKLKGEIEAKK